MKVWKRTLSGALVAVIVLTLLPGQGRPTGSAAVTSSWLGTNELTLTKLGTLAAGQLPPASVNGNIDCSEQPLIIRPEIRGPLPLQPVLQTEVTTDACVIETAYGVIDTHLPYIQVSYADSAGRLSPYSGTAGFVGIPNSPMTLVFSGGYMQIIRSLISNLHMTIDPLTHEVSYNVIGPSDFPLSDAAHNSLPVSYDSLSFSANGRWMVVNSPGRALLRVNLSSFEVVPLGPPFDYASGIGPNPQTAITNDGRYVVAGSSSFSTLKLYDLNSCDGPPIIITGPVSCQARDLWAWLGAKLPGFSGISTLRFVDDDILSLYAGAKPNTTEPLTIGKYNLSTQGHTRTQLGYLGMGDSFSSGEGAYHYLPGTDTANNLCHLSTVSYPFLVAQALDSNRFQSVACSGARMEDVRGSTDNYAGQVNDGLPLFQRDREAIVQAFTPGLLPQSDFIKRYVPETMTLSISGNDVGFADILKECISNLLHGTCYDTYEDRLELYQSINDQAAPLTALYKQLQRDAQPQTRLYAVGYPQLVYPGGNCAANVHLNSRELELAVTLVEQLNDVIKASAVSAGAVYIDVSQALAGHRLCETKSNNVAVNGLTLGNDLPGFTHGPIGNESYHPNQLGQQLLAKAILEASRRLTLGMPAKSSAKPQKASANKGLAGSKSTGRTIKKVIPSHAAPKNVRRKQTVTITHKSPRSGVAPHTTYRVTVGGRETGSFQSDENGSLVTTITIPPDTPTGYQPIDTIGTDDSGQIDDLHQIILIIDGPTDVNGNGTTDAEEPCQIVAASGHDLDHDGVDDACDNFIDEPSSSPGTTNTPLSAGPPSSDTVVATGQASAAPASFVNSHSPAASRPPTPSPSTPIAYQASQVLGAHSDTMSGPILATPLPNLSKSLPVSLLVFFFLLVFVALIVYQYLRPSKQGQR